MVWVTSIVPGPEWNGPVFVSVPLTLATYCVALSRKVWNKKIPAVTEDFF